MTCVWLCVLPLLQARAAGWILALLAPAAALLLV